MQNNKKEPRSCFYHLSEKFCLSKC